VKNITLHYWFLVPIQAATTMARGGIEDALGSE